MSGNFVITLLEYLNTLSVESKGEERENVLDIGLLVFSEQLHHCLWPCYCRLYQEVQSSPSEENVLI